MVPRLPNVTIFSATDRAALALARVVVTRLCSIRLQTRFASMALRCDPVRPSLAVLLRWRMEILGFRLFFRRLEQRRINIHAERKPEAGEFFFDFVERLFAEVAVFEHLGFGLHRELADGRDVGV